MASITALPAVPATRPIKASGLAALFGLFAGLCVLFAACVTLVDWHDETVQARWPIASAVVDSADVVVSHRGPSNANDKLWQLGARIQYEASGKTRVARLTSRPVNSQEEAAKLDFWAAQYRKGSHIEVRYDPSKPGRAVFAGSEGPFVADRLRTDLTLLMVAAVLSAVLLGVAKALVALEAPAIPGENSGQSGSLAIGLVTASMGLAIAGVALYRALQANLFASDSLMAVPAGLIFVFAGILVGLPPQFAKSRSWLTTLVVTCLAVTFDWVAFGPGERHFTGSAGGIGFIPGETMGRIVFGVVAVVIDICAVGMWVALLRATPGRSGSGLTGHGPGNQDASGV